MKLEIKLTLSEDVQHEFKYDIEPEQILEFVPKIINDFATALGITDEEMVQHMLIGSGLALQSIS